MLDPFITLATALRAGRGAYALLLGSGVSRSAKVPTGWDVMMNLIRCVATLRKESADPDPERWYRESYGAAPTYGQLLQALGPTAAERQQLLRKYFEPSEEERQRGEKQPTDAHHAISKLVASGYVRVIITTNFDRLIEQALDGVGVSPAVICTAEDVAGMVPLTHSRCVLVKVHGDYLDTLLRNTPFELDEYSAALDSLLDKIFDEYGLIVCGWSAEWDPALRRAIERAPARRYTTFWAARSQVSDAAQRLIIARGAQVLPIDSADTFFDQLADAIAAEGRGSPDFPMGDDAEIGALRLISHRFQSGRGPTRSMLFSGVRLGLVSS